MHESWNMAAVWKLPIVWLCENNGYAGSSPASAILAVTDVADMGVAYGMPHSKVDGNDAFAVLDALGPVIARARAGEGPSLVELKTFRIRSFAEGWADGRDPEEIEPWKRRDPIHSFRQRLLERGILHGKLVKEISDRAHREMESARAYAEESAFPTSEEAFEDLYTEA